MTTVRLLTADDAGLFKSLRLLAVEKSPTSIWPTREPLVQVRVNAENVAAKKLYASQGFERVGVEPRAMQIAGRFYDEEHMVKRLR